MLISLITLAVAVAVPIGRTSHESPKLMSAVQTFLEVNQAVSDVDPAYKAASGKQPDSMYKGILDMLDAISLDVLNAKTDAETDATATCTVNKDADVKAVTRTNSQQLSYNDLEGCEPSSTCASTIDGFEATYLSDSTEYAGLVASVISLETSEANSIAALLAAQISFNTTKQHLPSANRVKAFDNAIDILNQIKRGLAANGTITNPVLMTKVSTTGKDMIKDMPLASPVLFMISQVMRMEGPAQAKAVKDLMDLIDLVIATLTNSRTSEVAAQAAWEQSKSADLAAIQASIDGHNSDIAKFQKQKTSEKKKRDATLVTRDIALVNLNDKRDACLAGHMAYKMLVESAASELAALEKMKKLLGAAGLENQGMKIRDETTANGVAESADTLLSQQPTAQPTAQPTRLPTPAPTNPPLSASWGGWVNSYDNPANFDCAANAALNGISSVHDNGREDRQWRFRCGITSGLSAGTYSGETNWDAEWTREYSNRVMTGMRSRHDNGKEDRVFKFAWSYAPLNSCSWSHWSGWDASNNYFCPRNKYIAGINSKHDNGREDRVFRHKCCYITGNTLNGNY
jgi:hypothetical protein